MDLSPSERGTQWLERLRRFVERYVLPHDAAWHRHAHERRGATDDWFTTPEQLAAPARLR